jgi:hypothetical protein
LFEVEIGGFDKADVGGWTPCVRVGGEGFESGPSQDLEGRARHRGSGRKGRDERNDKQAPLLLARS